MNKFTNFNYFILDFILIMKQMSINQNLTLGFEMFAVFKTGGKQYKVKSGGNGGSKGGSKGGGKSGGESGYGGFCFDPNTLVQMANGSEKKIKDIQLGDNTKGGEVTGVFQFKASDEIEL